MESRRVILTSSCNEDVNKVYSTKKNKNYWIGYLGGTLEKRTSTNLLVHKTFQNLGQIEEIATDDHYFAVVSNTDGHLIHINLKTKK